jgi:hypothetical protein
MTKFRLICLLAMLAAVVSLSSPARAQTVLIYASPTGSNVNCSAIDPCALQTAIADLAAQSTDSQFVSCINGGNDMLSTLSTSNSGNFVVDCPGAVLTPGGSPILTLDGPSTQVVILRNLTFDGYGQFGAPFLKVTGGTTLIIENCKFQNLNAANAIAIQFLPSQAAAQLIIRDSVFANNGIAPSSGGGLQVIPTGTGSAAVKLERVSFEFNVTSMFMSGRVDATMINSTVSASRSNGIFVGSGTALDVIDLTLADNVGSAISVSAGGTVRLFNNLVKNNQIGISNSGGQALSYKNNRILNNGSTATLGTIAGGQ